MCSSDLRSTSRSSRQMVEVIQRRARQAAAGCVIALGASIPVSTALDNILLVLLLVAWAASGLFVATAGACVLGMGCSPGGGHPDGVLPSTPSLFSDVVLVGSRGTASGQFNKPRSLTVDRADNLYVVDMTEIGRAHV